MANTRTRALLLAALAAAFATTARADAVTEWNAIAIGATAVPPNSILQTRTLAIVHAAIYDAVRAVDRSGAAYAIDIAPEGDASIDAAVAAAAHATLVRLAPASKAMLDAALGAALAKLGDTPARRNGANLGAQVGERIVALRSGRRCRR